MTQFWVGGYGADMGGAATGIGVLRGDEGREPTTLAYRDAAASVASPSWLAQHPALDVVYAALEGQGAVQAFVRAGEAVLRPLGEPVAVGDSVCHVAVAPGGGFLVASCYGDGRVVRVGLDAAGRLVPDAVDKAAALRAALFEDGEGEGAGGASGADAPHAGRNGADSPTGGMSAPGSSRGAGAAASDPYADLAPDGAEPRVSHAHAAAFLPDGRIATTDLGFDLVRIWRAGAAGLALDHEVVLPKGVGPRHMVVHPSGHLHVVTEYSCEVFTLAVSPDGAWRLAAAKPVSPAAIVGVDFPAELSRSRDGETLYAGVRGSNTIAALRVRGDGSQLEPLALADAGVDWPRHHLLHDGLLLVSGQRSDEIAVLDVDERTGAPRGIRHRTPAPAPTHLLLAR
ncbi:lactonase family protein [Microbacterium sp. NPDC055903]